MLRMFVSGVDSLASDTLGTTFWYVRLMHDGVCL